jgi:hypothetical protein
MTLMVAHPVVITVMAKWERERERATALEATFLLLRGDRLAGCQRQRFGQSGVTRKVQTAKTQTDMSVDGEKFFFYIFI